MNEEQKKLLGVERLIMIQAIAEGYFYKTTDKQFSEAHPDLEYTYGLLTVEHIKVLKDYLRENFKLRGMDFEACVEQAGGKVMEDKLTEYESSILVNMADDILFTHYAVDKLKERFLNK